MNLSPNPPLAAVATLLSRCALPSDDIEPGYLADFVLATEGDTPLGVAGLQCVGASALVRSVAVDAPYRGRGLATRLLDAVEARARERGARRLYLLTNDAAGFFARHGYAPIERCTAPPEIKGCHQFGASCCGAATLMTKPMADR